jgi:hypothetical protein
MLKPFLRIKKKDPRVSPSPSPTTFQALSAKPLPEVYTKLANGSTFLRYPVLLNNIQAKSNENISI